MSSSPPSLPLDAGLPVASTLLDPAAALTFVRAELGHTAPVDRMRIRYLAYAPGRRLTVQYQLLGGHAPLDVAVVADGAGTTTTVYPRDPALGELADPAAALAALGLPAAGVERLAWVPGERAALRAGTVVLKLYARRAEAAAAVAAMAAVGDAVPTAGLVAAEVDRGLVAQWARPGRPLELDDAVTRGADAGALARRLADGVDATGLARFGPDEALAQADGPLTLASFARPEVADRLAEVRARLVATRPEGTDRVATHGDYNVGQLLDDDGALTVIDLDTLCAAAPALDVAAFATNVVSGRAGDEARADAALAAAVRGYGAVPADLDWYVAVTLLRRVDRAVRRLKRDWPERTRALVAAAVRATDALGA